MTRYGYARAGPIGQSLDSQIDALNGCACERIVTENASSRTIERPALVGLLASLQPEDQLWVTRLDRLARTVPDLCHIVAHLEKIGATLHCIEQPIETQTAAGRLMLPIIEAVAEFDIETRKERQLIGIAEAKAAGVYARFKKPVKFDPEEMRRMHRENMTVVQIARQLGTTKNTVYRALKLGAVNREDATS